MTNPWTARKIKEIRSKVLRLAAEDPSFRRRCLENAAAAITEVSGLEFPAESPRVRFVERLEEVVVVLPPLAQSELSDDDLQLAVGGLDAAKQQKAQECAKIWGLVGGVVVVDGTVSRAALSPVSWRSS